MGKVTASKAGARFLFRKDKDAEGSYKKDAKGQKVWYPAEDKPEALKRKFKPAPAKLRSTITAGTVLILLAGRFKGKRVVFLKQLPSGLLLVTGPYVVNGVPLRRVNQAYVIATSTKIDVSALKLEKVDDALFKKDKVGVAKGKEGFFAATKAKASGPNAEKKALQAQVDAAIKLDATMTAYLKDRFALSNGDKPHEMKF